MDKELRALYIFVLKHKDIPKFQVMRSMSYNLNYHFVFLKKPNKPNEGYYVSYLKKKRNKRK